MRADRPGFALVVFLASTNSALADDPQTDLAAVVARYRQLGDDFFAAGQYVEASEAYEKAERKLSDADQEAPGSLYQALGGSLAKAGATAFKDTRDYETAVRYFKRAEEAYQAGGVDVPSPLYRALARAYDQMGQVVPAYGAYTRFLGTARAEREEAGGGSPELEKAIREAEDARTRLKQRLDETAVQFQVQPDGTEIKVDRGFVGSSPVEPYPVSPGPHQITFWAPGYEPMSVDVDVKAGAVVPVIVSLLPEAKAVVVEPPRPEVPDDVDVLVDRELGASRPGRPWVAIGATAALAVVGAAGAAFLVWQAREKDDLGDETARTGSVDRANELEEEAALYFDLAKGAGAVALVSAGVGLFLFLASTADAKDSTAAAGVTVHPGRLLLTGRF